MAFTSDGGSHEQTGHLDRHKEAFIVLADTLELQRTRSGIEKHVRYSGEGSGHGHTAEDAHDRQFAVHLERYYDEVIARLHDAESIFIFGPGEAKVELRKRLEAKGMGKKVVGCETADKMTEHQVAARVQQHYAQ